MKPYKIFISSPGDVSAERELAREVIVRVDAWFGGRVNLDCYLWEHEPMLATQGDFQEQIPDCGEFDLVVCIFWSRLGSRLHPGRHQRSDGSSFASGTEFEFEQALAAHRTQGRPELLIYRRNQKRPESNGSEADEDRIRHQWKTLEDFWARWFQDSDNETFRLAYESHNDSSDFERSFEEHLKKLIIAFLAKDGDVQARLQPRRWWQGSPFRGLQAFHLEHEQIFFGRTKARDEILTALRFNYADRRTPFVLIFGASGSGKSSLMRAGIMPWLLKPGVIDGIEMWRYALVRPADTHGDLLEVLATSLIRNGALPELLADGSTVEQITAMLLDEPKILVGLIKGALSQAAAEKQRILEQEKNSPLLKQPVARLALALDQLEEVFTLRERFTDEDRRRFFRAISALAQSGYVWIVATLRSEFYSCCEEIPELIELTRGSGQYRLLSPTEIELSQMIRLPAEAAGMMFEDDLNKGKLDEVIAHEAYNQPGALPLLEYALEMLYEKGSDRGLFTHADYEKIGRVSGAVAKKAEQTFQTLPSWAQESLDHVFKQLILLLDSNVPTRQTVAEHELVKFAGARELMTAFVEARLFTKDANSQGEIVVTFAHEALLKLWARAVTWIENNRSYLQQRGRLSQAMRVWQGNFQHQDYLLSAGLPLSEAEHLLEQGHDSLSEDEISFISLSKNKATSAERRRTRIRRIVITSLSILTIGAITGLIFALFEKDKAVKARNQAEDILDYLVFELRDQLAPVGRLDIVSNVQSKVDDYYKHLGVNSGDIDSLGRKGIALQNEGELLYNQGNLVSALKCYQQSQDIFKQAIQSEPGNAKWQRNYGLALTRIGNIETVQGSLDQALDCYEKTADVDHNLLTLDPLNLEYQRDTCVTIQKIGDVQQLKGQTDLALASYQSSLKVCKSENIDTTDLKQKETWQNDVCYCLILVGEELKNKNLFNNAYDIYSEALATNSDLITEDSKNVEWRQALGLILDRIGELYRLEGKLGLALKSFQSSLSVYRKLSQDDPLNWQLMENVSQSLMEVANLQFQMTNVDSSLESQEEAVAIRTQLVKHEPTNQKWLRELATAITAEGLGKQNNGNDDEAKQDYQSALDIDRTLVSLNPSITQYHCDLIDTLNDLETIESDEGRLEDALKFAQESLAEGRALVANHPDQDTFEIVLSNCLDHTGDCLDKIGNDKSNLTDYSTALPLYKESLEIKRKIFAANPSNKDCLRSVGLSLSKCGYTELGLLEYGDCLTTFNEYLDVTRQLEQMDPQNNIWKRDAGIALINVGDAQKVNGYADKALASYHDSLEIRLNLLISDPDNLQLGIDAAESIQKIVASAPKNNEADDDIKRLEEIANKHSDSPDLWMKLAFIKQIKGNFQAAESNYEKGFSSTKNDDSIDSDVFVYNAVYLWVCRQHIGKNSKATEELRELIKLHISSSRSDWTASVMSYILNKSSHADLLSQAKTPGEKCEAWYYCGVKKLFAGDRKAASEAFQNALSTKATNWLEYMLTEGELASSN